VIFGRRDKMANPDYLDALPFAAWNSKVFKLAEAGHAAHIDQPNEFNKLLLQYCESVFK
jgi:pimeloyl-ACP methyl ester carboxylesterase